MIGNVGALDSTMLSHLLDGTMHGDSPRPSLTVWRRAKIYSVSRSIGIGRFLATDHRCFDESGICAIIFARCQPCFSRQCTKHSSSIWKRVMQPIVASGNTMLPTQPTGW